MKKASNAPPLDISEADFQQEVLDLFHACGWAHNFTRRCRGKGNAWTTPTSMVGWPDLTLWTPRHGGLIILRELKTMKGVVSDEQLECLDSLHAAKVDAKVWRPDQWDREIEPMAVHGLGLAA